MKDSDLRDLLKTLKKLENSNIVKAYERKRLLFTYNFFMGMARGLGTVVGATIVVAILVFLITQLQWAPVVGDWVRSFLFFIEDNQSLPTPTN